MNISIDQACNLWDKLRDAMEGKGSHGYETEIYAYTLMPYIPSIDMKSLSKENNVYYINAAKSLVDIINLFHNKYPNVCIFIDGEEPSFWIKEIQEQFIHRVKVEVRIII